MADPKSLLDPVFPKKHVQAMSIHHQKAVDHLQKQEWEDAISRSGKFVEAALKAVSHAAKKPLATGRSFKVDTVILELSQLPKGAVDDTLRLLIPRACRFVYDVASNRGGRH